MGVLQLFGTFIKNNITSTAIKSDFKEKMIINHLLLDFNSIIYVSSAIITGEINKFMQLVLKSLYNQQNIMNNAFLTENFEKYKMLDIQKTITLNLKPEEVVLMFKKHFNDKYLDILIITSVINIILRLIKTYCHNKHIKTLMIAIDGVPSKSKMLESRQRRYLGALSDEYKIKILHKYKDYLLQQENFIYISIKDEIKWNRNKITPGTGFMNKLINYLKSDKVQEKFKINRHNMNIILSDMYEIGEGEKKIVNYINKYLTNTNDSIVFYSPDTDVLLLCMLLPVKNLFMLHYNQQTSSQSGRNVYDLVDIQMMKSNISYYVNNNPNYSKKENFDIDRINYDIVCISTLFGNDFVPKIETLNVKKGFQSIMDAYIKSLMDFKHKGYYLVNTSETGVYFLNLIFLKTVFKYLLPEEIDFIKYNKLYAQYVTLGQIKYVFDYMEINSENLVSVYYNFVNEYNFFKEAIQRNANLSNFENDNQFMGSLKKAAIIIMDGECVSTSYISNKEMITLLKTYYKKYKDFPRLNINLNTRSNSIDDLRHKKIIKEKNLNEYQKEIYKFDHLLDKYYVKFNAQPLDLSKNKINEYYKEYFDVAIIDEKGNLTNEAFKVMQDYIEGLLWVFKYYYNDPSYISKWYYVHERAPLLEHLIMFLDNINLEYFTNIYINLSKYDVENLEDFFNPLELFMYVSPMTKDVVKLLPSNYKKYLRSENMDPFLKIFFVNIYKLADKLWNETISNNVDCRSIAFLNKCLFKTLEKPSSLDDLHFLEAIRKVKPNEISNKRSQIKNPKFHTQ